MYSNCAEVVRSNAEAGLRILSKFSNAYFSDAAAFFLIALATAVIFVSVGCADYSAREQRLSAACNAGDQTACADYQTCSQAMAGRWLNPAAPALACKDISSNQ